MNTPVKTSLERPRNFATGRVRTVGKHLKSAFIALVPICFALPHSAQAVSPSPRGG
jgi:hypothetical protein